MVLNTVKSVTQYNDSPPSNCVKRNTGIIHAEGMTECLLKGSHYGVTGSMR